ncbi:MAG: DEAD/DEAH box helicase [Phycisphaerae bacterium]|nr:DEAD/DEAH box helicase [Phycisphaerae bacterium]
MELRDYQAAAYKAIMQEFDAGKRTLCVLPTGTGKTFVFCKTIQSVSGTGQRALIVAHRDLLIDQAAKEIRETVELSVDVEMGDRWAYRGQMYDPAQVIASSIQTQCAGCDGRGRMTNFDPKEFGILVVDEAHHAPAKTYRRVIDFYGSGNPDIKILGVTATPDRADEQALGQIFETVAFEYALETAINDGWLVPIRQRMAEATSLDFSSCKMTAGDLNGRDMEETMLYEKPLHEVALGAIKYSEDRKTLVFAASVAHAERLCEIFIDRYHASARWVCGKTPKDERTILFQDFRARKYQYLVNVGVATEGFNDPGIECVVMARPTASRALYAQMTGRGTRTLPGVIDGIDDPGNRRQAIAESGKTHLLVVDFVGNCGKHKLMSTTDILGGQYADEVQERARKNMSEADRDCDVDEELQKAEQQLATEAERERRKHILAKVTFRSKEVNPFNMLDVHPPREVHWDKSKQLSDKMKAFLEGRGIDHSQLTWTQARKLISTLIDRQNDGLCTFKQARRLRMNGVDPLEMTFEEAGVEITKIAEKQGWGQRKAASRA